MLKKLDQEFLATLEDETELEKRIAGLVRSKFWHTFTAVALAILICGHILWLLVTYNNSISDKNPFGIHIPVPMTLMPAMFLLLLLVNVIKAVVAHTELRMLLLFKKLRDDKVFVTP